MGLFDDILSADQTLIQNNEALDYDYTPERIPFRENEQQYLATCIKPLFNGRSGRNLLIYGAPGIGKSVATKAVLKELEEQTDEIHIIYINCWQHNTSFKVTSEICDQIGYKFTQNKKSSDLQKIIADIVNKKSVVFVFDEIDKTEDTDFLYFLLEKVFRRSIFLITNYKSWLLSLDERIKSRLMPELVEFKEYNLKETEGILQERIKIAFYPNVWENLAVKKVVDKTYNIKDIRAGLFLLKESTLLAEDKSQRKVSDEFVDSAIKKLDEFSIKDQEDLTEDEKFMLEIIKNNSGKKIGDLFKIYQNNSGKSSYKTFQRKINKLDEGKYIKITKQTGVGGNTTIVEKKFSEY